jgi:hypothetical protein
MVNLKENICFLELDPEELIDLFLFFVENDKQFLNEKTSYEYLQFCLKIDEEAIIVLENLNMQNERFFQFLRDKNKTRKFKKDYFD